jgi:hypothetical protein
MRVSPERGVLITHTAATFLGAALLFSVQPLFARLVLPLLGGSPAVWNTALTFYQALLLLGYAYAHASLRWLGARRQAMLHVPLLAIACLTLPIRVPAGWSPPTDASPIPWLLVLMTVSLGAPFLAVSTTSPVLQRWFAETRHPAAADPYFLYAASNVGGLLGLLAYPLLLEPTLSLEAQSRLWSAGYVTLALLSAACWLFARRATAAPAAPPGPQSASFSIGISTSRRLRWVLRAFAPASLVLGVTTFLSSDIAAVPLLWVIPLALYLSSYVVAFAGGGGSRVGRAATRAIPYVVLPLAVGLAARLTEPMVLLIPFHLLALFVVALACHARLAADRPAPEHLTEFYFWIALGGVLAGAFNAILAPVLFTSIAEYPLTLALAVLLARETHDAGPPRQRALDVALPLGLCALTGALLLRSQGGEAGDLVRASLSGRALLFGPPVLICLTFVRRPVRFALGIGAILLAGSLWYGDSSGLLHAERSFFGVHRVRRSILMGAGESDSYHVLVHGNTVHGAQSVDGSRRLDPLVYYHPAGPIGQVFASLPVTQAQPVAVVGLGTGSLACYGRPGQAWTFYEIDPAVERIARDERYFTFLRDCPPRVAVTLGDARISLRAAADRSYGALVLDAYSSDAIPVHLITREALALYLEKLAPAGVLAFHISNRHFDLAPVLAALAKDAGLVCFVRYDTGEVEQHTGRGASGSTWAVMARTHDDLAPLIESNLWSSASDAGPLWTDRFASVLSVFRWR